jgi:hypothetical protein
MSKVIGLRSYLVVFVFLLALFRIGHAEEHFDMCKDLQYGVILIRFLYHF